MTSLRNSRWITRITTTFVVLLVIFALTGCGKSQSQTQKDRYGTMLLPQTVATTKVWRVGVVSAYGGAGELAINTAVEQAVYRAGQNLGVKTMLLKHGDFANNREAMEYLINNGCDLILGLGQSQEEDMAAEAKANPDVLFGGVDINIQASNVISQLFREDEAAYLAGVLAAQATRTKVVAFVGGANWPEINSQEKAFRAGVDYISKQQGLTQPIQVKAGYVGLLDKAFNQPEKGKALALSLIDGGADVVFHVAGQSGEGAIQAAAERKVYAIGSGYDQTKEYPYVVLASTVKNYQPVIYQMLTELTKGKLKPGTTISGIKAKGVALTWSPMLLNPQWVTTVNQAAYQF